MPSLDAIRAANTGTAREVKVPYGDPPAITNLQYDPGKATGELLASVEESPTITTMATALAELAEGWDLTLDEPKKGKPAEPFPPTRENLLKLPMGFLVAMFTAIGQDLNPTGEASGSFGAG